MLQASQHDDVVNRHWCDPGGLQRLACTRSVVDEEVGHRL